MTMLYSNLGYNEMCYKGPVLGIIFLCVQPVTHTIWAST